MKKEIGGYFELEEMAGEEYYPDLYKVNLGRTALLWLLESHQYKKIYLPVFLCQSVIDICRDHDIEVEFYHLDADLNILLEERELPAEECLYLVSYYGQLTDEKILYYQKVYGNVIVDHTHSFFRNRLREWIPCIPVGNSGASVMGHMYQRILLYPGRSRRTDPVDV